MSSQLCWYSNLLLLLLLSNYLFQLYSFVSMLRGVCIWKDICYWMNTLPTRSQLIETRKPMIKVFILYIFYCKNFMNTNFSLQPQHFLFLHKWNSKKVHSQPDYFSPTSILTLTLALVILLSTLRENYISSILSRSPTVTLSFPTSSFPGTLLFIYVYIVIISIICFHHFSI